MTELNILNTPIATNMFPPVPLSVEELARCIHAADHRRGNYDKGVFTWEGLGDTQDIYRSEARAVLEFIASRIPVWDLVEPGEFLKKGTRVREVYKQNASEWVWQIDDRWDGTADGVLFRLRGTPPADPDADLVESMARAIHATLSPDPREWDDMSSASQVAYRDEARAALDAYRAYTVPEVTE